MFLTVSLLIAPVDLEDIAYTKFLAAFGLRVS